MCFYVKIAQMKTNNNLDRLYTCIALYQDNTTALNPPPTCFHVQCNFTFHAVARTKTYTIHRPANKLHATRRCAIAKREDYR